MSTLSYYRAAYKRYHDMVGSCLTQVKDSDFFAPLTPESNSIAVIVKHLGGNFRSRFTDFLTSDGEKTWRERDSEFIVEGMTRVSIMQQWQEGWDTLWQVLEELESADLNKIITIRSAELTVEEALMRSLTHFSYHVGEIIVLARYFAKDTWEYLSIAPNQSEAFNEQMRAKVAASKN